MKVLDKFTHQAANAATQQELRDIFSSAIKALGYGAFDAWSIKPGTVDNADAPLNFGICDYDTSIAQDYFRGGWLHNDPTIAEAGRTSVPFEYLDFLRSCPPSLSVKWQLALLRLYQVQRAWIVPLSIAGAVRGMSVYMGGKKPDDQRLFFDTRHEIHLMCTVFMDRFVKLREGLADEGDPWQSNEKSLAAIGPREVECLHWAARGKTNWEIGKILDISENTVRYHLKKAYKRLEANTRSRAVSRALRAGVIEL